jgi:beta-N-acetylhexosaminidase
VTAQPSPAALTTTATPTIAQMVGQKLVVKMDSAVPSASLLGRIRRGEVGGVILFGEDISSTSQLKALTAQLHAAAAAGGQPRLLVMTDQEGGLIRRIPWAPPTMSAKAMGTDGRTSTARNQGFLTGQALKSLGVDVDLAPVGDVPISTSSFMWLANRTFGFTPSVVSPLSNAFALGLRDGGTVATMKHFPGIGRALKNTDSSTVTITAPLTWLQGRDLVPYRTAILNRIPMIMLSNANYPALDPTWGAGWSRAIGINLLRTQMGFKGVTITDSLTAAANTRGLTSAFLAMEAAANGTDMELLTGSEASTSSVFNYMVKKAEAGAIGTPTLTNSYRRIIALKAGL